TRAEVARNATPDEAVLLLANFDEIQDAMQEMIAEAGLIFRYLDAGSAGEAAQRMATMDRKYAGLNQALSRLFGSVRVIWNAHFQEQLRAAGLLRVLEYLIL